MRKLVAYMKNFVVIEGVCCSGKTTFCNLLQESLNKLGWCTYYNHGAFTDTDIGNNFKLQSKNMNWNIGAVYYLGDLILNTQQIIRPMLRETIVLQDRYTDSISSFVAAYGKYSNDCCNIDSVMSHLQESNMLLTPIITVYCVPSLDTVMERMKYGRHNDIHDYYRKNPAFLKLLYEDMVERSQNTKNCLIVQTDSAKSINEAINEIIDLLKEKNLT